jgi:hypothetical protein
MSYTTISTEIIFNSIDIAVTSTAIGCLDVLHNNLLIEFSLKLITNSIDIDSRIADAITEDFWQLM